MQKFPRLVLVATVLSSGLVQAQFPLVNTTSIGIVPLGSLSSGMHFIDIQTPSDAGVRTIYNTDLSVYRVLNFPAPPANMYWSSMRFITDALFDTDPSTVEFVMTANTSNGPGDFATFIYREDGNELFSQVPGNMVIGVGGATNGFEPIYTTDDGTFMAVHTAGVWGPPVNIYQLPGSLPCWDCFNTPHPAEIGLGGTNGVDVTSGMALFPNPSAQEVQVRFDPEVIVDRLVIIDTSGREVLSQPTNGVARMSLDISHLASGQYTVITTKNAVRVGSLPLVVVR